MLQNWPNLFIVGAPKAGTTTVAKVLSSHPDVFVSKIKEPHHFIMENNPYAPGFLYVRLDVVKDQSDYLNLYKNAAAFRYRCDASTSYLQYFNAATNIKKKVPAAKIIIILRNPIERAFSQYFHNRRLKAEPIDTFEDALDAEEKRKKDNFFRHYFYKDTGLYFDQVKNYIEVFGNENVLVLFYEELNSCPKSFYSKIFNFLGISSISNISYSLYENRGDKINYQSFMVKFYRKLKDNFLFYCFYKILKKIFYRPLSLENKKFVYLNLLDLKLRVLNKLAPTKMSQKTKMIMINEFRSDIQKLQALLGVDLSHWLK